MDPAKTELIAALCAQAGMLMEDASVLAVTMRRLGAERVGEVLAQLQADVSAMATLLAAAQTLYERD